MELGYLWIICFDQDTYGHADLVGKPDRDLLAAAKTRNHAHHWLCNFEDRNIGICPNDFSSDEKTLLEVQTWQHVSGP